MNFWLILASVFIYSLSIKLVNFIVIRSSKDFKDGFVLLLPVAIYASLSSYLLHLLIGPNSIFEALTFGAVLYLLALVFLTTIYKWLRPDKYAKLVEKNSIY